MTRQLSALVVWAGLALGALGASGCGDDSVTGSGGSGGQGGAGGAGRMGGAGGSGPPMAASLVTNSALFSQPLDAVPNRDGSAIYFTAFDANGAAQVFLVPADGGNPTPLVTGASPLEVPSGLAIAPDDSALYIADLTAARGSQGDLGGLYRLALPGGGTPTALGGGDAAIYPISIAVSADGATLFFTGAQVADAAPAVFSMPAGGGAATALTAGGQLRDPSGIAVGADGTAYVLDTIAGGESSAAVLAIRSSGAPTVLAADLRVGFPAGLTLARDGAELIVSAAPRGGQPGVILSLPVGGTTASPLDFTSASVTSPAGLHRASGANVFALADDLAPNAGTGQTGAIFKLQ